jgi:hypothetical protein
MGNDDHPDGRPDDDPRWRITPTKIVVTVILLAAIVLPLLTSTYSRTDPRLFGFPFFYWYQFLWVFLAAGCCWVSYLLLRRETRAYQARHDTSLTPPTGPPPGETRPDGPRRATDNTDDRRAE